MPVWVTTSAPEGTFMVTGAGITVAGLGITNRDMTGDGVRITGSRVLFDRCTVVGDPHHGLRRGWLTHGSQIKILGCHADDIFRVGFDSCCVGGWEGGDNIVVDDCYLCGGAEGIMYGGADCSSPAMIPHHITITHTTLTKQRAWYERGDIQLKNGFELKCADHVTMSDCLVEGGGIWEGQGGYVILLTVRNQDGNAPWAHITDVLIERCHFRFGGAGISFLGHDDQYPSGVLKDIVIRDCAFTDLDSNGFTCSADHPGTGRVAFFHNNPQTVTMDGITASGVNLSALGYFANVPNQPTGLVLRNWKYPETWYGWKVDDGGMDVPPAHAAISALMPDLVYEVTAADPGAEGYPEG